ncbi:MAG: hypothetical protein Solumvirus1_25 [Solumvirus sp.]|uniref:Uncharacterized protein n=1 Tax=Solumvirus sp. TaxID=2487773 RepID=A0A3G5AG32_9VIRU|nr:MAG: hypothetical protein Solumvirus1_25 [Solumvirus sp.]
MGTKTAKTADSKSNHNGTDKHSMNSIFAECADLIEDQYWVSIFESAACGKFPKKFTCKNNQLIFKKGTKTEILKIPESSEDALPELLDFFRRNGDMMSAADEKLVIDERNETSKMCNHDEIWSSWKNLKKSTKSQLLDNYITSLDKQLFLNKFEEAQLKEVIILGIANKSFDNDSIILKDMAIDKIIGLYYDPITRKFSINSTKKSKAASKQRTSTKNDNKKKKGVIDFCCDWKSVLDSYHGGSKYRNKKQVKTQDAKKIVIKIK